MKRLKALAWMGLVALATVAATGGTRTTVSPQEEKFLQDVCIADSVEIELGKLAQKNGGSKFVMGFGKMMVTDHVVAHEELMQLAKSQKIELSMELEPKHRWLMARLSKLHGAAFDKAYKREVILGHRAVYEAFTTMSKTAENSNVKNYAIKYTQIVQMHLQVLQTGDLGPMGLNQGG